MLFSHANSTNIAKMRYYIMFLGVMLKTDVISYEYRGYEERKHDQMHVNPSDTNILKDAMHVYDFLVNNLNYKPSQIILYG
jgi:hypothetical protein